MPSAPTTVPLDRRIVLSGLWVTMLFVFAYVDILAFWRSHAPPAWCETNRAGRPDRGRHATGSSLRTLGTPSAR